MVEWQHFKFHRLMKKHQQDRDLLEQQLQKEASLWGAQELGGAQKREDIERYQQQKWEQHQQRQEAQRHIRIQEELEKRQKIQDNEGRVAWRQLQIEEKFQQKKQTAEHELQSNKVHQKMLENLKSKVAPRVTSDPKRVHQDTEASRCRVNNAEKSSMVTSEIHKCFGYKDAEIMADRRFKILLALKEAGLEATSYGKYIIQTTISNTVTQRKDALTFAEREQGKAVEFSNF